MKYFADKSVVIALFAAACFTGNGTAQTSDALLDTLIRKGVLTEAEAKAIQADAAKENPRTPKLESKTNSKNFKLSGDFRLRYDGLYDRLSVVDRNRLRYRLRAGLTYTFHDDWEIGLRLSSGDAGANPLGANQTFGGNGSKKGVSIDTAYVKWSRAINDDFSLNFTGGKMYSPFVFTDMVLDPDYTPEGFAQQFVYKLNSEHALKLTLGEFVLNELPASSQDPYLGVAQLRLDSQWNPRWKTSLGVSALAIAGKNSLPTPPAPAGVPAIPDINKGNARTAGGLLVYNYNPIVVDGAVTYTLAQMPLYPGAFPITLSGEYLNNPAAAHSPNGHQAYNIALTLGKAGQRGQWDFSYRWKRLEGDAWYEELVDDDFGGIYRTASLKNGVGGLSYGTGTNVRGHILRASYSPLDAMTLSVTYFLTDLVHPSPAGAASGSQRIQLDAVWKF